MEESFISCQLVFRIAHTPLGRRRLAARSGLSEMTVRLELERLQKLGFVSLRRSGAQLTRAGRTRFKDLLARVKAVEEIELITLRLDVIAMGAVVSAAGNVPAWQQRDLAIREGATALLAFRRSRGKWCFAENDEPVALRNPDDAAALEAVFPASDVQDHLIVAFGPNRRCATSGLWRIIARMTQAN